MKQKLWLAASAAALLTSASPQMSYANEDLGQCHGVNSCKGQSACQSSNNSCAGQNSCKGKGWIKTSQADCEKKGGKFKPLK